MPDPVLNRRPERSAAGMTLVEILVALVLVSVVILSVAELFAQGIRLTYDARVKSEAMSIVKSKLEELKSLAFDDPKLNTGGSIPPTTSVTGYWDALGQDGQAVTSGQIYTRQWIVELPDPGNPDLRQITVVVTKNSPIAGKAFSVQATTLRARG